MSTSDQDIIIKGARMHNLKNIDVVIPYNKLTVVTGVSGSGKSSLTMDTLFAEGQRRYVESLSSYARQFMKNMTKPDVDSIEGLCPAIAIEQKVVSSSPRSSVGSMTEINEYLRILYARIGRTYSPISGKEVTKDEVQDIVDEITKLTFDQKVIVLIPLPEYSKKNPAYYLNELLQQGYSRLYDIKKKEYTEIEDILAAKKIKFTKNDYILIDRFKTKDYSKNEDDLHRVADSIQTAFSETGGDVYLEIDEKIKHYCNRFEADGILFDTPVPNMFSENNPHGACPKCEGYGQSIGIDPELVIPNPKLSLYEEAVACWKGEKMSNYLKRFIAKSEKSNFPIHRPINKLTPEEYELLWEGKGGIMDFFGMVQQNLYKIQYRILQARYRGKTTCPDCKGKKLRNESLYVKVNKTDIASLYSMPIEKLKVWLNSLELDKGEQKIAKRLLIEINSRVDTLLTVGLNYLSLNRKANTLSGGESQRIQLTRIIGSNLTDSLYILDEPSIGLHARDTKQLISVLQKLKELGNTVVVVEHDELIMRDADHIIDMGPLASHLGGKVVAEGNYKKLIKNKKSLTAQYLNEDLVVNLKKAKRAVDKLKKPVHKLSLSDCCEHNLKNIDVDFPLNNLVVVTGVSGSGKTTLVKRILYPALKNAKDQYEVKPGAFGELTGDVHLVDAVEMVDQNPIGRSSRSNPVSYIKAYDDIRNLYAAQQIAKLRGYKTGHFSFNVDGGRCDSCKGDGYITVEMQFLADVKLLCEHCNGQRFKEEVLEVKYHGKNIADVLDLSVDESLEFFAENTKIQKKLQALADVGLGYIKLGQSSDTLSGGEAQRVKLASFLLMSNKASKMLFIFDEPTTGLHFHDIVKLLKSFEALIQNGHSVIVIEHNMDVIKNADWIIDLGPEGGEHGGSLLYNGPLKGLKKVKKSYTGMYL